MYIRKIKLGDTFYDIRDTDAYHIYPDLASMIADEQLIAGDTCIIDNDYDMKYRIVESGTANDITVYELDNDLYAELIPTSNAMAYGLKNDGTSDDVTILNTALAYNDVIELPENGNIKVSNSVILNSNQVLKGNNATISPLNNNQFAVVYGEDKSNIKVQDLKVTGAYRGLFFLSCENISIYNIYVNVKNNWAYTFRLCKKVYGENLTEYADYPANTVYNNTDFIHLNGCIDGHFKNLYGQAYDDFIALNADESTADYGDIKNITIENAVTYLNTTLLDNNANNECTRCFRIMANTHKVQNITFKNCIMKSKKLGIGIINLTSNSTATAELVSNIYFDHCNLSFDNDGYTTTNMLPIDVKTGTLRFDNCDISWNVSDIEPLIRITKNVNELIITNSTISCNDANNHNFIHITSDGSISNLYITNCKISNSNTVFIMNYGGQITDAILNDNKIYGNSENKKNIIRCTNDGQMRSITANNNICYYQDKLVSVNATQTQELIVTANGNIYRGAVADNDVEFSSMSYIRLKGDMISTSDMLVLSHNGDHYLKLADSAITMKVVSNSNLKTVDYTA